MARSPHRPGSARCGERPLHASQQIADQSPIRPCGGKEFDMGYQETPGSGHRRLPDFDLIMHKAAARLRREVPRASGRINGRKALIIGGDSGFGQAAAIAY